MKHRLIFTLLLIGITSTLAAQQLVWKSFNHDFGAFSEDLNTVTTSFEAINVGETPVSIINASANCGCTVPSYSREPVAPGDTLRVTVVYNAVGRPGKFHKKVMLTISDGSKATLHVNGTVVGSPSTIQSRYPVEVGNVHISNKISPMGSTVKGRMLAGGINIYNSSDHPITPIVKNLPPHIHAALKPLEIPVGEQGFLSLTAYTGKTDLWGTIEDSFTLIPDSTHPADSLSIATVMIIKEDFSKLTPEQLEKAPKASISTESVDFDRIAGQKPVSQTFTITNNGHSPLLVRRIDTAEKALDVNLSSTEIARGKSAKVTVTLNPAKLLSDAPLNARISFIFNDPEMPNANVRVVGIPSK